MVLGLRGQCLRSGATVLLARVQATLTKGGQTTKRSYELTVCQGLQRECFVNMRAAACTPVGERTATNYRP